MSDTAQDPRPAHTVKEEFGPSNRRGLLFQLIPDLEYSRVKSEWLEDRRKWQEAGAVEFSGSLDEQCARVQKLLDFAREQNKMALENARAFLIVVTISATLATSELPRVALANPSSALYFGQAALFFAFLFFASSAVLLVRMFSPVLGTAFHESRPKFIGNRFVFDDPSGGTPRLQLLVDAWDYVTFTGRYRMRVLELAFRSLRNAIICLMICFLTSFLMIPRPSRLPSTTQPVRVERPIESLAAGLSVSS